MLPQIHQGVINCWHILKTFLKEEEIVKCSNGWNPLSTKPKIRKNKHFNKKKEARKEEGTVTSTSKPQANQTPQEGKKNKKKNWKKPYSPSYRIPRIQKDSLENVFRMVRTLISFRDKEEERMRQPSFTNK
ncbi:hypothetical protein O181_084248 [Austropuccinia psidii MF-1]|uniref:Uncharacterized protein n=1 Tax=Austropuccinia psidii MF-1 TaxID=1389203 RepID=A0A9Q3FQX7_9BASI|nr:hypothetical protein [Austropuccinia psidii MF-1]